MKTQQPLQPFRLMERAEEAYRELEAQKGIVAAEMGLPMWDLQVAHDPRVAELDVKYRNLRRQITATNVALRSSRTASAEIQFEQANYAYRSTRDPRALRDLYDAYWKLMRGNADIDIYANKLMHQYETDVWTQLYVATLLNPKPDPMGRFILADQYINQYDHQGPAAHLTAMSGMKKTLLLCEVHPDDEIAPREGYVRAHSMSPGGARFNGQAFGTTGYLGTVLGLRAYYMKKGIFSWQGGGGRTMQGGELWEGLVQRGLAYESSDVDNASYAEYGFGPKREYMDFETAAKNMFLVFHVTDKTGDVSQFGLRPNLRNTWGKDTNTDEPSYDVSISNKLSRLFEKDKATPIIKDELAQTMLANSVHGSSPFLMLTIAETLARSGATDKAATYLSRADVAQIVLQYPHLLEILGQQRLPGLSGLAPDMRRSVFAAVEEAKNKIPVDWAAENPLRLQPLSAAQRKVLAKYDGLD